MSLRVSAVCAPGLDAFAAEELRALGLGRGGTEFTGGLKELYRANLHLATADRVLLELAKFPAASFPELARRAAGVPWERCLVPGRPVAFRVSCRRSKLYHERAVAERLAGGVERRLGQASPVVKSSDEDDGPAPQILFVRLENDVCTVLADSSGAPLHKRGYRLAVAKAPLRETLAAAVVRASGWDPATPLLDPFCGSGTVAIEAALWARRRAPGLNRRFAFMDWPGHDAALWEELREEARRGEADVAPAIMASDRDAGAVRAARANAERAGMSAFIRFDERAVSAVTPPTGPGTVATNPPYGVRIGERKPLRDLYMRFGAVLKERCPGWRAAILCADPRLLREAGLPADDALPMMNGGLPVRLVRGTVGR